MMDLFWFEIGLQILIAVILLRLLYFMVRGEINARRNVSYSQHPSNPKQRILCLGDSLIAGVGASTPSKSLVGLIGRDFPAAEIINWSRKGINTRELFDFVKQQHIEYYDFALIEVGGMNVLEFTNLKKLQAQIEEFISLLKERCDKIFMIVPNNAGYMPIYHIPVSDVINWQSHKVHDMFKKVAQKYSCTVIDVNIEVLLIDSKKNFSYDHIHPSDAGYALWYQTIKPFFEQEKSQPTEIVAA